MKILKFKLSGKTAFFKKPDVNQTVFFTYGNIHKPALLGIIGAVLGISGYAQQHENDYPRYYEELNDLKLAIVPNIEGSFQRTIQTYNNSTGFWNKSACKKGGANLIVKEQWLINPSWNIYIDLNHIKGKEIEFAFKNQSFIFNPYLGNNSHPADISDIDVLNGRETNEYKNIDSIFEVSAASISKELLDDCDDDEHIVINPFKFNESLPIGLTNGSNYYLYEKMIHTNMILEPNKSIVNVDGKNICLI